MSKVTLVLFAILFGSAVNAITPTADQLRSNVQDLSKILKDLVEMFKSNTKIQASQIHDLNNHAQLQNPGVEYAKIQRFQDVPEFSRVFQNFVKCVDGKLARMNEIISDFLSKPLHVFYHESWASHDKNTDDYSKNDKNARLALVQCLVGLSHNNNMNIKDVWSNFKRSLMDCGDLHHANRAS